MRLCNKIFAVGLMVMGMMSCAKDVNKTQLSDSSQYEAPVLESISDVIIDSNNNKVEAVTFNWSPAYFGAPVQIEYDLYMASGENTILIGTSYENSVTVQKTDLNSFATSIGIEKNSTANVSAYLVAYVYELIEEGTVQSNTISFNIQTFDAPKSWIYLPGFYQGWNNVGTPFYETEGGNKKYRILAEFTEDVTNTPGYCPFKLYDGTNWLGYNDGYEPAWGRIFENSDGNFAVPADEPINIITVDMNKKTVSREVVTSVGIIGSFAASNSWANDVLFSYDAGNNVWQTEALDFVDGDEFLIRFNASWDGSNKYGDATSKSSEVEGGYELVQGSEAANIKIPSAGTYVMKLYGNHTPFVLVMEKQ